MKTLLFAAALIAVSPLAQAATYRHGSLEIREPWSRPAAAGTSGIGYMVLVNRGPKAQVLETVETPLASKVEMHSSSMSGGVMSMAREERVTIPAGGTVTFGPGAYHLMLLGLTKALKAGDRVPATLGFAGGAKVKVAFLVSAGMGPPTPTSATH